MKESKTKQSLREQDIDLGKFFELATRYKIHVNGL